MKNIVKIFLFLFICFSPITLPLGTLGIGITGRIALADVFGALGVLSYIFYISVNKRKIIIPKLSYYYIIFILLLFFGVWAVNNKGIFFTEILIHLFLGIIFVVSANIFSTEQDFHNIVLIFVFSAAISSCLGLSDVIIKPLTFLPKYIIGSELQINVGAGTFRNSGQAGAYMLVVSFLSISYISNFDMGKFKRILYYIATILVILFLFLSVKLAAYLGFVIGMSIYLIRQKSIRKFLILVGIVCFVIFVSVFISTKNESFKNWVEIKFDKYINLDKDSFHYVNYRNAIRAFIENPIIGAGYTGLIGKYPGKYSKFEIHSTYLKVICGGGILGFIGYLLFQICILKLIFSDKNNVILSNTFHNFINTIGGFYIALLISWGYTYHVRKREFWILLIIIYLASRLQYIYTQDEKKISN